MRNLGKLIAALAAVVLIIVGCSDESSPQSRELEKQQGGYTTLTNNQPIEQMEYSPDRETINNWIKNWDQPGKLSFMYLLGGNGEYLGYYVLEGLPVSYCTSGTPPYTWVDRPGDGSSAKTQVEAPAMNGVYYSGFECSRYYAFEAETGKFLDWVAGDGLNQFVLDEPVEGIETQPLPGGTTKVEDVETTE